LIQEVNNILSTASVQTVSNSQSAEKKDNPSSIKNISDSYTRTSSHYYTTTYIPPNYQLDDFEKNLSPEDLKYFVFNPNTGYRVPNFGAPVAMKQQWLEYSKKMSQEGFSPEDLSKMSLGSTPSSIIFFPPEDASAYTKKAFLDAINQMDPLDASNIMSTIRDQFAEPFDPDDFNTPNYWNRISKGVSNISSYNELFKRTLEDLKIGEKQADKNNVKYMQKLENCMNTLIETFTKYNVK